MFGQINNLQCGSCNTAWYNNESRNSPPAIADKTMGTFTFNTPASMFCDCSFCKNFPHILPENWQEPTQESKDLDVDTNTRLHLDGDHQWVIRQTTSDQKTHPSGISFFGSPNSSNVNITAENPKVVDSEFVKDSQILVHCSVTFTTLADNKPLEKLESEDYLTGLKLIQQMIEQVIESSGQNEDVDGSSSPRSIECGAECNAMPTPEFYRKSVHDSVLGPAVEFLGSFVPAAVVSNTQTNHTSTNLPPMGNNDENGSASGSRSEHITPESSNSPCGIEVSLESTEFETVMKSSPVLGTVSDVTTNLNPTSIAPMQNNVISLTTGPLPSTFASELPVKETMEPTSTSTFSLTPCSNTSTYVSEVEAVSPIQRPVSPGPLPPCSFGCRTVSLTNNASSQITWHPAEQDDDWLIDQHVDSIAAITSENGTNTDVFQLISSLKLPSSILAEILDVTCENDGCVYSPGSNYPSASTIEIDNSAFGPVDSSTANAEIAAPVDLNPAMLPKVPTKNSEFIFGTRQSTNLFTLGSSNTRTSSKNLQHLSTTRRRQFRFKIPSTCHFSRCRQNEKAALETKISDSQSVSNISSLLSSLSVGSTTEEKKFTFKKQLPEIPKITSGNLFEFKTTPSNVSPALTQQNDMSQQTKNASSFEFFPENSSTNVEIESVPPIQPMFENQESSLCKNDTQFIADPNCRKLIKAVRRKDPLCHRKKN